MSERERLSLENEQTEKLARWHRHAIRRKATPSGQNYFRPRTEADRERDARIMGEAREIIPPKKR